MRTIILFVIYIHLQSGVNRTFAQKGRLDREYIAQGYYRGVLMAFNKFEQFTFRYKGDISSDTAAGRYSISSDTIYLTYLYNNYDSILAQNRKRNEQTPPDVILSATRDGLRPMILVKKKAIILF